MSHFKAMSLLALIVCLQAQPAQAAVETAGLDRLLRSHVKDGVVDYAALAQPAQRQVLSRYLAAVAAADEQGEGDRPHRLAAWLNAYNALVIESVLAGRSPASMVGRFSFFKLDRYRVFGRSMTLDQVENTLIRPTFHEPRVHFALVCASKSCPPLRAEAYQGPRLNRQLDEQARAFMGDAEKNRFEAATRQVALSSIFKWYSGDFEKSAGSVLRYVQPFVPVQARGWSAGPGVTLTYLPYDWTLNGKL